MGLTIDIAGSLLCDKGGQMTVRRVRQQYPTLKQNTSDHLQIPSETTSFLFHLSVSPFTLSITRLCRA